MGAVTTAMPGYVADSVALKSISMHADHFGWEIRIEGPLAVKLVRGKRRISVTFTRRGQIAKAEKITGFKTKATLMNAKLNGVLDWMEEK